MERQTKQRHAIEAAIREGGRPLLPAELVTLAQETVPGINIATVYRCVKALAEEGVITTSVATSASVSLTFPGAAAA
jgi:Fur family ferric uptake transcriptional regulator